MCLLILMSSFAIFSFAVNNNEMTGTVRPDNQKRTQQKPYIEQENCDAMNHLIAVGVIWSVFVYLNLEMN